MHVYRSISTGTTRKIDANNWSWAAAVCNTLVLVQQHLQYKLYTRITLLQGKLHFSSISFRCRRKPREQDGAEGPCVPVLWTPGTRCWLWQGVGCPLVMQCSYIQNLFLLNNQLLRSLGRTAACGLRRAKQIRTTAVTAAQPESWGGRGAGAVSPGCCGSFLCEF